MELVRSARRLTQKGPTRKDREPVSGIVCTLMERPNRPVRTKPDSASVYGLGFLGTVNRFVRLSTLMVEKHKVAP